MNAIDSAKQEIAATGRRLGDAVRAVFGSRVAVAVTAAFSIAFGCQLVYAIDRPPPVAGLSLVQLGLPPIELGRAGEVAQEAGAAAMRNGLPEQVANFFAAHPAIVPWVNVAGFALCASLFVWTLYLQTRQYKRRPELLKG